MTNPPVHLGAHGKAFAANMHTMRKAQKITLDHMVEKLSARGVAITPDQLIRIEAGQRRASVDEACEIARALQTKLHRLVLPSRLVLAPAQPVPPVFTDHTPAT